MPKGKIISFNGGNASIFYNNEIINCSIKGLFRKLKIKPTVGDDVIFNEEKKVVEDILPRKNIFLRPSISNLDHVFVVSSLKEPLFSRELLNIFLSFLAPYNVDTSIIFTKTDLMDDIPYYLEQDYLNMGYKCYFFAKNKELDSSLKEEFKGTIALLGQTGVGKSTLINRFIPSAKLTTSSISKALGRGKHTTTASTLIPYEKGFLIDTPGFSSVELNYYKEDLASYYPSFSLYKPCYFHDCLHLKEKDCAIIKALEEGKIKKIDYEIYQKLLANLPYRKDRFSR